MVKIWLLSSLYTYIFIYLFLLTGLKRKTDHVDCKEIPQSLNHFYPLLNQTTTGETREFYMCKQYARAHTHAHTHSDYRSWIRINHFAGQLDYFIILQFIYEKPIKTCNLITISKLGFREFCRTWRFSLMIV